MQIVPLGKKTVTSAGTRVQLSSTIKHCHSVIIRALPTNGVNKIYIGDVTVANNFTGAFYVLEAGDVFSSAALGLNSLDLTTIYIDADSNNGDVVAGAIIE